MRIGYLLCLLCFSTMLKASEEALSVDQVVPKNVELAFPNPNNIQADISDFDVLSLVLMSNEEGERWAVVTVENTSTGRRTLTQKHLLGLFANGERRAPLDFKQILNGREIMSLTIGFGESKFPLLGVYSRLD
ncbi:hypothetical protein [Pseudoalteromonas xiamenensis]|uniref:Uncharacterized protein n=1 Tax=Pseudoalteromonas xiamenensis TaxID=882626 RepID=A0A975DKS2_9GAMM|nr:hypothetical protein [Pseudoalteromonas xiamenensis]QTH73548.1 hypothetical protein J5O05_18860 [Pseudoalteromonas xiamenensis]